MKSKSGILINCMCLKTDECAFAFLYEQKIKLLVDEITCVGKVLVTQCHLKSNYILIVL